MDNECKCKVVEKIGNECECKKGNTAFNPSNLWFILLSLQSFVVRFYTLC